MQKKKKKYRTKSKSKKKRKKQNSRFRTTYRIASGDARERVLALLYAAMASHIVGDRPGRSEPRAVKRRPKSHKLLTVPRHVARKRLAV